MVPPHLQEEDLGELYTAKATFYRLTKGIDCNVLASPGTPSRRI